MHKVTPNRLKLLIYWTNGAGTAGRVMWMRQKTHTARLKRARHLVNKYRGKYNAAIIYDCPAGSSLGVELERYNSKGNLVIEKPAPC